MNFGKLFFDLKNCINIGLFEIVNSLAPRLIPLILFNQYASFVGAYSLVNMVLAGLILIPTSLFAAFYTEIIVKVQQKEKKQIGEYNRANIFLFLTGTFIATILFFLFDDAVFLVMGNKYSADFALIDFLFFIVPFTFINNFHNLLLLAFGKNQEVMRINLLHFLSSTIFFTIILHYNGIVGALLSYILNEFLFSVIRYFIVNGIVKRKAASQILSSI
jgi:O-antigen/teichoic acid export membrane protein